MGKFHIFDVVEVIFRGNCGHAEESEKLLHRPCVPGGNTVCSSSSSGSTIEQTLLYSPEQIKHLGPRAPLLLCYRSCGSRQIRQVTCALSEQDTEPQPPLRPLETDASLSLVDKTRTAHRRRQRCHPAGIGLPTEAAPSSSLTLASAGRIKLSENPKVPRQHH